MLRNYIVSLKSKYILLYILSILLFFLFLYESDSKIGFISYIGNNYLPLVTCSIFFSFNYWRANCLYAMKYHIFLRIKENKLVTQILCIEFLNSLIFIIITYILPFYNQLAYMPKIYMLYLINISILYLMISCLNTAALFVSKRITKILLMAPFLLMFVFHYLIMLPILEKLWRRQSNDTTCKYFYRFS